MYQAIFDHPEMGKMLNLTQSAKYLGISRARFRRIAPAPEYLESSIYPYWSKRVLDILPVDECDYKKVAREGRACGKYLIGPMSDEDKRDFRKNIDLQKYGIIRRFGSARERDAFFAGIYGSIKDYVRGKISNMTQDERRRYVMQFWGGGSFEQLLVS